MKHSVSWPGIAAALIFISGCANQNHWTSSLGEDSPVTMGGVRVANENPGGQGPVADNSRLAINHRDVARREALARERLARDEEARRRTQVTDQTYSRSSAPEGQAHQGAAASAKKARKHVAHARKGHSGAVKRASVTPGEQAAGRPEALRQISQEVALNELHHINQKEIALAKLAKTNARSSEIKDIAARIRRDHERLDARVWEVAKAREITLAEFTPATHEGVRMDKLEKLTGPNFDQAFAEGMKDGHKLTAAELRLLRARVGDREVLALIDQALPKVRHHEHSSGNLLSTLRAGNDVSARR